MELLLGLVLALRTWHAPMPAPVVAAPVAGAHALLVGDVRGDVVAFDPASGRRRWGMQLANGVWSSPLVAGSLALVTIGSPAFITNRPSSYVLAGPGTSRIVALRLANGAYAWTYGLPGSGAPAAALADGLVIHLGGSGEVLALDARTGAYRWRRFVGSAAASSATLALVGGRVAFSGAGPNAVYVLRARDGAPLATTRLPSDALGVASEPLAVEGTTLFGAYFAREASTMRLHLYAIDARSGALRWDRALDAGTAARPTRLSVRDGTLYLGSPFAPRLCAYRASDGAQRWSAPLAARSLGGVIVRGGVVFAADGSGTIAALDARTGQFRGSLHEVANFERSAPAAVGASLAIGSATGALWSIPFASIEAARR